MTRAPEPLCCSTDTEGEVQRATAHLHSFVILKVQNVLQQRVRTEFPTEGLLLTYRTKKKTEEGVEETAGIERHQLETSIMQ